jgi:hypothetical protein
MAGLNMKALEDAQKELTKKGGSKGWIQLSKIENAIDVRIQDPVPAMNGIYYLEVPIWWINSVKIVSPKLFGVGEPDPIKDIIEEAKRAKDPDILALLNAKSSENMPKIQYKPEYWIPIVKFNWELDSQNNIKGIKDKDGNIDPNLVMKFIEDGRWKFLVVGVMALKAINEIATKRGGSLMTDQLKGFNLILSKSGKLRDTKYSVVKDTEPIPMPAELYTPEVMVDPFLVAQAGMYTKEYMEAVIGKYLYNDVEVPEKSDDIYAYPELRAELKARFADEEEAVEPKQSARQRPGTRVADECPAAEAAKTTAPAATEPVITHVPTRGSVESAPARTRGTASTEAKAPGRPGRPATTRGPGRPARNVADDLKEV